MRRRTNDGDEDPFETSGIDDPRRRFGGCSHYNVLRAATLLAALLLLMNAMLQQNTNVFAATPMPSPMPPRAVSSPPSPPSRPDAAPQCVDMARAHRVVPGVSWGTLQGAAQVRWKELRCDEIVTPDILLDRRAGAVATPAVDTAAALPAAHGPLRNGAGGARAPRRPSVPVYYGGLGGYRVFRIPALARAARMLLAFAEARPTVDDHGRIDIVLRRSLDGGRTWGPLLVVARGASRAANGGGGETVGNPVPIFLRRENTLLLLYCSNAAHMTEDAIRDGKGDAGRRVWLTKSFDAGSNWTAPVEITPSVKLGHWTWYATGPGGAIVLHNGSLAVPATHADGQGPVGTGKDHSHLLLSHDRGETWHLGAIGAAQTNEATIAQLPDQSILLNARDVSGVGRRVIQISSDLGESWGAPRRAPELLEPPPRGCHGSMVATPTGRTLFFSGPSSTAGREKLTLRRSDDGGHTWPRSLLLWAGPSAYSSLRLLPDGVHLGVLYERGEGVGAFFAQQIVFERVRLGEESPLGALTESGGA